MKTKIFFFSFLFLCPLLASAFGFPNLKAFSVEVGEVLKIVLNIAIALAFIAFFWGVAKFILAAGDAKAITDGKQFMIYAVFALFALVSINGILIFARSQFGFGNTLPTTTDFLPNDSVDSRVIPEP
ncbi:MAG: hypothetical protein NTV02_02280 [Candidatus Zambryskibacteria bacterium]|nr:hypothetical protein [Candidatus Zambryskibacteria bacterium]